MLNDIIVLNSNPAGGYDIEFTKPVPDSLVSVDNPAACTLTLTADNNANSRMHSLTSAQDVGSNEVRALLLGDAGRT